MCNEINMLPVVKKQVSFIKWAVNIFRDRCKVTSKSRMPNCHISPKGQNMSVISYTRLPASCVARLRSGQPRIRG